MPINLGLGGDVTVAPPALPSITVAPPNPATVMVLPVAGPPGPVGGTSFTHTQAIAQSVWTVTHDFGRYPVAWSLFDDAGRECDNYLIQHLTVNTLLVSMDQPTAGIIRFL